MKRVENYVRFMVDSGLIFEINRQVLHPLGLAIVVNVHEENNKWLAIEGLYKVDSEDKEGFLFDEETFNVGYEKYRRYLLKSGQKMLDSRNNILGYIIQNLDTINTDKEFAVKEEKDELI